MHTDQLTNKKKKKKKEPDLIVHQGPVFQSIVRLTKSLGEDLLSLTVLTKSGPEVIKLFSCSTQLSINFFLLINVKMPTIVMRGKNSILGLSEPKKAEFLDVTYEHLKFHAQLS